MFYLWFSELPHSFVHGMGDDSIEGCAKRANAKF